jgi:hypothetical protein
MTEADKKYIIEQITYLMYQAGQGSVQGYQLTAWSNIINRVLVIPTTNPLNNE